MSTAVCALFMVGRFCIATLERRDFLLSIGGSTTPEVLFLRLPKDIDRDARRNIPPTRLPWSCTAAIGAMEARRMVDNTAPTPPLPPALSGLWSARSSLDVRKDVRRSEDSMVSA
mmetsp:Transcript_23308/g.53940  ORF Transcript_23308/g.53940 Transcript_23308/m.53940 type:complete len:115 (+) Transcript_23308:1218-1562(+)